MFGWRRKPAPAPAVTSQAVAGSPTVGLDFGQALRWLKRGHRVRRAGWNGKGMWLALSGNIGGTAVEAEKFWSPLNREFAESRYDGRAFVLPCITMKTADDTILMGWLASQTDMLAEDWELA